MPSNGPAEVSILVFFRMLVASRRGVSRRAKCAKELDGRGFCLQLVFVGSMDRSSDAMAGFGRRTVEARRARRRLNWAEQGARRGGMVVAAPTPGAMASASASKPGGGGGGAPPKPPP